MFFYISIVGVRVACFAFSFGYAWGLYCRGRRYPVSATPTHMLRICANSHDDPLLSRGEHCSPAKNHKETFPLSYFCMTKSTKSHIRGLSSLLYISSPVSATPTNALRALVHSPRARVSRASHAWQVRAAQDRAKIGSFAAPHSLILPRVRT